LISRASLSPGWILKGWLAMAPLAGQIPKLNHKRSTQQVISDISEKRMGFRARLRRGRALAGRRA
jgi:hypothetical protein